MDGHRGLPACVPTHFSHYAAPSGSHDICPRGNGDIAPPARAASSFASIGRCVRGHARKYPCPKYFRLVETDFGKNQAPDFGATVRRNVPERECLFALPSALGIAGNRLPPYDATHSPLVDPYGEFLFLSTQHGNRRFDN